MMGDFDQSLGIWADEGLNNFDDISAARFDGFEAFYDSIWAFPPGNPSGPSTVPPPYWNDQVHTYVVSHSLHDKLLSSRVRMT